MAGRGSPFSPTSAKWTYLQWVGKAANHITLHSTQLLHGAGHRNKVAWVNGSTKHGKLGKNPVCDLYNPRTKIYYYYSSYILKGCRTDINKEEYATETTHGPQSSKVVPTCPLQKKFVNP